MAPDERSGHDIALKVDIQPGVPTEHIECPSHKTTVRRDQSSNQCVSLSKDDTVPNRDFTLRYRVAGDATKTAMMTHKDDSGRYFSMMLIPPRQLRTQHRDPLEMVFVLDCSGSMSGQPLHQVKVAVRQALTTTEPRDTFQLIRFSSNASQLGDRPLPATPDNVRKALQWLDALNCGGGTEMIQGLRAALNFPHDEGRLRLVPFMTDGFIGNQQQVLTTLHHELGTARVFSFGVGNAPNRYLMNRMAAIGRGAVACLERDDDASDVMRHFCEHISHPALADISIDWGDMQVSDVYPTRIPDLIVGRPVLITERYTGTPGTVRVSGRAAGATVEHRIGGDLNQDSHEGIAAVWARHRIKDLMNQLTTRPESHEQIRQLVLQTAVNHSLMSSYTAYIAVDPLTTTAGEFGTTVAVPTPTPAGVRYDTTVNGGG